jgi:hypothetical protein
MSTFRLSRFIPLLLGLGALIGSAGCGGSAKTDVSGTIKLRGQAPKLTGLQIVFLHPDGSMVSASVGEDGVYRAEGVPSGELKVCFTYLTPEVVQMGVEAKTSTGGGRLKKPGADKGESSQPQVKTVAPQGPKINPIPTALRDTSTSKVMVKIESGKTNTFDYDIKD